MSNRTVFENALLIDGNGGEPLEDAAVVVEDRSIKEILTKGQHLSASEARQFDLKGRTLMPGLIDAHVHVGNIEIDHARTAALPPAVYPNKPLLDRTAQPVRIIQ